ncbi:uncharacterized protein LOC129584699 [Paramacrobiotus metropolitanus]|uniref:uncharacterized protein LOC129584699 n=1 Tax=Paramacrobiotus metropolitanus TaxID=2943436 RepID=UPI00244627E4|nr:uncharacterized protein LOC129584699 [Paramacrobiotus metropolitanus]
MEKLNPISTLLLAVLWILATSSAGTDAALVNNIRIPTSLASLLNGNITINGNNITVTVGGLGNLTTAQQQVVAGLLLRNLLPGGFGSGYPFDLGGLGYQYGFNVGDYLGTSGPAAAAAAAYVNPLLAAGYQQAPVVTTSLFPFQNLVAGGVGNFFGYAPSSLGAVLSSPNPSPLYTPYAPTLGSYSGVLAGR